MHELTAITSDPIDPNLLLLEPTAFVMPRGFRPTHGWLNILDPYTMVEFRDDEGVLLAVHSTAFSSGPLKLWRPVVGGVRITLRYPDRTCPCIAPDYRGVLYGEI